MTIFYIDNKEIAKDSCLRSAIVPIVEENQCRTWYRESNAALSNGNSDTFCFRELISTKIIVCLQ